MFSSKLLKGSSYVVAGACLANSFSSCALATGEGAENSRNGVYVVAENATIFSDEGYFFDFKSGYFVGEGVFVKLSKNEARDFCDELYSSGLIDLDGYNKLLDNVVNKARAANYLSSTENIEELVEGDKENSDIDIENGTYFNRKEGVFVDLKNGYIIYGSFERCNKETLKMGFEKLCAAGVIHEDEADKMRPLLNTKNVDLSYSKEFLAFLFAALSVVIGFELYYFLAAAKKMPSTYVKENKGKQILEIYRQKSPICRAYSYTKNMFNGYSFNGLKIAAGKVKAGASGVFNKFVEKIKVSLRDTLYKEEELIKSSKEKDKKIAELQKTLERKNREPKMFIFANFFELKSNGAIRKLLDDILNEQEKLVKENKRLEEENLFLKNQQSSNIQ